MSKKISIFTFILMLTTSAMANDTYEYLNAKFESQARYLLIKKIINDNYRCSLHISGSEPEIESTFLRIKKLNASEVLSYFPRTEFHLMVWAKEDNLTLKSGSYQLRMIAVGELLIKQTEKIWHCQLENTDDWDWTF
jgi:hypothetical protein